MSNQKSTSTDNEFLDKDLLAKADALEAQRNELSKAEKALTKDVIATLKKLINTTPYFEAIRWHQYTPGFNDGDPCLFTIGDLEVKFVDDILERYKNEEAGENEEFVDSYAVEKFIKSNIDVINSDELTILERQYEAINKLWSTLISMETELQNEFGGNMRIMVNKSGIETEDYDPGY